MGGPLNEAAVESIELEQVGKEIALTWPTFRGLYNELEKSAKKVNIANVTQAAGTTRSAWRESLIIQGASGIQVGTGDGSPLGSGTGSKTASFAMAPIWAFNVTQYTRLAEMATNGAERGVESFTKSEIKRSIKQFYNGIESLFNGDGSGAADQIPLTATVSSSSGSGDTTSFITGIPCAAAFVDQQVVQFFPSEGGTSRGTATISFVDVVGQTLWFSTALPSTGGATAVGDYIMVAGTSGVAGSSVLGIPYWNTNGNTGTKGGLSLSAYPSRLSTPVINLGGSQITPSVAQRAMVLLTRALGDDAEELEKGVWYGKPEQAATIASQWYDLMVTQNKESESINITDRARAGLPDTFGERKYIYSNTAKAGRVDLLFLENWALGELCPVGLYDFGGGNTVMPVTDTSGNPGATYITSKMFVYEWGGQICNRNPRHGLFITNAGTINI
ncbi:MAG TPA: hypothetical protein VN517_03670 [Terriglobales bacterium]|nr:hypothetical protein [Terriglobales bacterium]